MPIRTGAGDRNSGLRVGALPAIYGVWLAGSLASQLGDAALYFALGWAASAIGGSAAGLVLSAIALPRTVLLLLGGVVGDRAGARRIMITGDAVMLVVSLVVGAVAYRCGTSLVLLVVAGLVIGIVDAFYLPSLGSMPRRLVRDDQLARAVALRQSGSQLVTMIGGPIGGVLIAFAGFAAAVWSDAASFAVVLAVLIVIRPRFDAPALPKREPILRAAADGLRVAARTPGLGPALLLVAGAAGFIIPSTSLLVPLLARHSHWSAASAGLLIGAQGVGVIVSSLVVAHRGSAPRPGVAAAAGLATTAAGQLLVAMLPSAAAAVPCAVLIGVGSGTFVGNLAPVLLGTAPRSHLARIQSLLSVVQSAALLLTNNVLGAVAHLASAPIALMCCSSALAGCAATALSTPTLRQLTKSAGRERGNDVIDSRPGRDGRLTNMGDQTRGIGAVARASGLSVSALRFYDSAGVLRPAHVDPSTGYRWYTAEQVAQAQLIAVLRRVSMSVPDICEVLAARHDQAAADRLLDQHLRRLEDGLIDARRQLDNARNLLDHHGNPMTTMTVLGGDLEDALAAVQFAMSENPELPALCGVLFDYDGSTLRLVASDRYRLAVATVVASNQQGPPVQAIAPRSLTDDCTLPRDAEVSVRLDPRTVHIGDRHSAGIDAIFPDYQRLLQTTPEHQITITAAELHERLTTGPTCILTQAPGDVPHEVSLVLIVDDGTVAVIEHDHPDAVGFNREFLLQAINAARTDQLVLDFDGPITPLAIRNPDRPNDLSLLMPTRLS